MDFGRWEKLGALGEGGQGEVILVEDRKDEYQGVFALKTLKEGYDPKAYERFRREVAAIRRVAHPGIVKIVDCSKEGDETQYYVMEYVEGARTLNDAVASETNPFRGNPLKSLDFVIELLAALEACHSEGIIHRDLSPKNILLDPPDDRIRIIDFGVCYTEGQVPVTLTGESVGTKHYMAPECESGAVGPVSPQCDLYSAGKLLWHVITGKRAFSREDPVFTRMSMRREFPDRPRTWHLHHVFERTIRHDPANRWTSAQMGIEKCRLLRRTIEDGYPPLEQLAEMRCPICGLSQLATFQGSYTVFGNPNPKGIVAVRCEYCGCCMAVDQRLAQKNLRDRESMK